MGHTRLGLLPKTRKWRELVKQIAGPRLAGNVVATAAFYIDAIAAQTLDASRNLDNVAHDSGVRYTFYLLTQVGPRLYTGLRLGELRGLTWESYKPAQDEESLGLLHVKRSVWRTQLPRHCYAN